MEQSFQKIEEMCALLRNEPGPALDWISKVTQDFADIDPFTRYGFMDAKEKQRTPVPILQKVFYLLHECLLNQRWPCSLDILQKLCSIPAGSSSTIWKVGSELLAMHGSENRDLLQQLYNKMKVLADINSQQVAIEFAIYLLYIGEKDEAINIFQEHISIVGKSQNVEGLDEKLRKAYLGLVWYVEWRSYQQKIQQCEQDKVDGKGSQDIHSSLLNYEMQTSNYAKKALQCFDALNGVPGVWDIFILKHVEVLVSMEGVEAGEALLQGYLEARPDNLHPHKYMYQFLLTYNSHQEKLLNILKKIATLSPSDALVIELCKRLPPESQIGHLFQLLDYAVWQNDLSPWQQLINCLEHLLYRKEGVAEGQRAVADCWSERKSWWPAYHFSRHMASQGGTHDLTLLKLKATAASCLIGQGCEFTKLCYARLTPDESEAVSRTSLWNTDFVT
ncbi:TATA box-binding protein-associated factor RNA polymerase I subunit A-like [Mya arenaria]|uniref:TATA box-binding protein-associated factor RNA polymerase I subunit A-like n=1 Tax=Mya arenaria TaxID=6604 RepID=UPI0022E26A2C|nr:TATA box-binding protein-associated factor RNA polymerase I subunit A-like [Mya arenaria]